MLSSRNTALLTMLLVAAAALALLVPFMIFGNASGHDFEFHLASWMDVVHQWHQRVLYPRWAELANWGYGEPRFVFYPPLSWMLGAGLSLLLPWPMVPGAFYWICLMVAGASMFRLAREWLPAGDAGFAALLYAVNPYHQLHIYWRSDFAELLAAAVFPLLVLYAIRTGQGERRALAPLAGWVAAVWLMNAPAAVISTYTVALLLAVTALQRRSGSGLVLGGGALLLGFALATFYILPAAYEQSWVNIVEVLSSGLRPQDNFLFTWSNDSEHTFFNFLVSKVAVAELVAAALAGYGARSLRQRRDAWWPLAALLAVSALLMLPVTALAWRFLPELRFVQFPWRWLFALNAPLAVLLADALARRRRALLWSVPLLVLALCAFLLARGAWWDSDGANDLYQAVLVQGAGYFGADEYGARGSDHYDLDQKAAHVAAVPSGDGAPGARIQVNRWRAERKVFTAHCDRPLTVALRLMNYPAWKVTINGHAAVARSDKASGGMLLDLPAGDSRVEVRLSRTPDRLWGGVVSALAAGVWLLLALLPGRGEDGPYPLPAD